MEIKFTSLHHIDHNEEKIEKIDIKNQGNILHQYISRLIKEITNSPNRRSFLFQRDTTEIYSAIKDLINEEFDKGSDIIAKRLLPIEKSAQEKIAHLGVEIQKGSLFQTIIRNDDGEFIIISKADHNEFVDDKDFLIHKGLPWKKHVFKAFMAKIEGNNDISKVYIYDTNSNMTRYWWNNYFELVPFHTDSHNTKTSLDVLDMKVFNQIKKEYPADHTILRNSSIGYFRSKNDFDISEFISDVFENYKSVDDSFPLKNTIEKIQRLPEKWKFDNRFTISKNDINKRAINKIPLAVNVELVIKDSIHLDDLITAGIDEEGVKYIKIKSNNGYERFKR